MPSAVPAAVAFLPHPPALVPAVGRGAGAELDVLRAACRDAIRAVAADAERVVLLGAGAASRRHPAGTRGSLAGWGEPVEARLGDGSGERASQTALPLSLTIGAWLLADALADPPPAEGIEVRAGDTPQLPAGGALLVLGDASARRSTAAPGYLDERAEAFDRSVADALASGDPARLAGLDAELGAALLAAGMPAWQAAGRALAGARYEASIGYDAAPLGVGYLVATWR